MLGDVRQFVENCEVCQMEKFDHQLAKGKLTSTQGPEEKWKEISIDFITDLPMTSENKDSILTIVDKATAYGTSCIMSQKHNCGSYFPVIVEQCGEIAWSSQGNLFRSRAAVHCE